MKKAAARRGAIDTRQALALHRCISVLMREFRIEPGLLAGSVYADLHANDIGFFEVLATGETTWTVRGIAQALSAPVTTVSSALDRLERRGLIERRRIEEDRRVVCVALTANGRRLAERLRAAHIENCRAMLSRLTARDRDEFVRMAAQICGEVSPNAAG